MVLPNIIYNLKVFLLFASLRLSSIEAMNMSETRDHIEQAPSPASAPEPPKGDELWKLQNSYLTTIDTYRRQYEHLTSWMTWVTREEREALASEF
jgi:hypothetical protein